MQKKSILQNIVLPDGSQISLEANKLAILADGSILLKHNKTILLGTAVSEANSEVLNFLPLSVDYKEKYAAAGKIPGGFLKREGKLSDHEVLVCRLVDRTIRPCFPENFHEKVQVNVLLLSTEVNTEPDQLAVLAASTALSLSAIPFYEPVSAVKVARIDSAFVINPKTEALERADMNITVSGAYDRILMIEGEMNEAQEEDLIQAIQFAHEEIKKHCQVQKKLMEAAGKTKLEVKEEPNTELERYNSLFYNKIYQVASAALPSKEERSAAFKEILDTYIAGLEGDSIEEETEQAKENFGLVKQKVLRELILKEGKRIDGRQKDEVRPISIEIDFLPAAHGSVLFTRGETQVLTSVTLGSKQDEQIIDGVTKSGFNKFMLHYDFPSFSTNNAAPSRGPSRREIGHGNLAMRGLKAMLPSEEDNPYTIRLHSTTLSSNGSSSMATLCGGSLGLMDAGIKLKKTVAGVAMGLISEPTTNTHVVLTDILGEEDALGDMDFKVAGTKDGLTACQMDIKMKGISYEVLRKALEQAKKARLHIIEKMEAVLDQPKSEFKSHVPRIQALKIPRSKIAAVIGSKGKVIQEIQQVTSTTVTVSEEDNQGVVYVLAPEKKSLDHAVGIIQSIVEGPNVGQVYTGKISSITKFGLFVEFLPGTDGLIRMRELSDEYITEDQLKERFKVGQKVSVELTKIRNGQYALALESS